MSYEPDFPEPIWDDTPPPFEDADFADAPRTERHAGPDLDSLIWQTIVAALAALNHQTASVVRQFITELTSSTEALGRLSKKRQATVERFSVEMLRECTNLTDDAPVSIADTAVMRFVPSAVTDLISEAVNLPVGLRPASAFAAWDATTRRVRRAIAAETMVATTTLIDANAADDDIKAAFDRIVVPIVGRRDHDERWIATVDESILEWEATSSNVRFSSGYPSLDMALSRDDQPVGFIAPGENVLFLGPTGTGKSSMSYGLARGMAADLSRQYPHALSLFAHTEELSSDKARAIGLGRDPATKRAYRWDRFSKSIVIADIGSSRRQLATLYFRAVAHAAERSQLTGMPPTAFAPWLLHLDYLQAIREASENDNVSVDRTSEMIIRGFQAGNPDEVEKYSGVRYAELTGSLWPEGLDGFRTAVVSYAQLRKSPSDKVLTFSPKVDPYEFCIESDDASGLAWELRPGDARLYKKEDIRGSALPLQNATTVILLHRSVPQNNPSVPGPDGRETLKDHRARLLIDKARNGQNLTYVPMRFDVDATAFRAQYYDPNGERVYEMVPHRFESEFFVESGDPLIPNRGQRHPFENVRF